MMANDCHYTLRVSSDEVLVGQLARCSQSGYYGETALITPSGTEILASHLLF